MKGERSQFPGMNFYLLDDLCIVAVCPAGHEECNGPAIASCKWMGIERGFEWQCLGGEKVQVSLEALNWIHERAMRCPELAAEHEKNLRWNKEREEALMREKESVDYDKKPTEEELAALRKSEFFDFGEALRHLKAGRHVARVGWNGKNMYLFLATPTLLTLPPEVREVLPSIAMMTAQTNIVVGWLASQTDMLAEDWELVN